MGNRAATRDGGGGGRRRWTLRRVGMWVGCLLLGAVVAGELGARYIVGLGDPPLFVMDPEIEYLLRPDQRCRRFGHDYVVNSHSMRSDEFVTKKPEGQLRVMVIGDSVVNGGGKIDQQELATTILQRELAASLKRDVVVGNISAPSWGPPNQLAYAKKYGLFDADVVVIVSNSDDWDDVPGLEYIGSAWPREKPWCALQELVGVYGWKALCRAAGRAAEPPPAARTPPVTHEQDVERCRAAYVELIALAKERGAKVAVVQHFKRSELKGKPQPGYDAMNSWAVSAGVVPTSDADLFRRGISEQRLTMSALPEPFQPGDDIHPNAAGQHLLEFVLKDALMKELAPAEVPLPVPGASPPVSSEAPSRSPAQNPKPIP